jgi:hypothetical protein
LPSSNSDALDLDAEMVPEYIKALLNDVHLRAAPFESPFVLLAILGS